MRRNLTPITMRLTVLVLLMAGFEFVTTQPLHQPAVPFNCGNIRCPRRGFYACVDADIEEPACYPCKMKLSTCGMTEEFPGCNLFCEDQLIKKHERILQSYNMTYHEQTRKIDEMSSQIESLKHALLEQNVTIVQLTERSKRLNSTINVEHATIEELKLDGANCSKQGFMEAITCILNNWPVFSAIVFILCGVLILVAVVLGIKYYRLRKQKHLIDKSTVDTDVKTPLTEQESIVSDDSLDSMKLGDMGVSNGSFSSGEITPRCCGRSTKRSSSNNNTSAHGNCFGEEKLNHVNPTDGKINDSYQPARP